MRIPWYAWNLFYNEILKVYSIMQASTMHLSKILVVLLG